jgi:hypothetical protein
MIRKLILFFILNACWISLWAQNDYPDGYFRSPVDFRMLLSGTFGELRTNHFHSGIDIKTNGKGGEKIYAVADGYVSRIKISAYGFGKTLYITHPNGYVSVYAHLDRFNRELSAYTKARHYRNQSFELNHFPEKGQLPVKKGELIAYSGNSGYSFGPHLHFEIREEAGQKPVNPLLFGLEVKDFIRPKMVTLTVFPALSSVLVEDSNQPYSVELQGWGENYRIPGFDTISVTGPVYFGIETYDLLNDASNRNGVYSVTLLKEGDTVYAFHAEKFSFSERRYINSLIDYSTYVQKKKRVVKSKIEPNNKLSMYGPYGNGVVSFDEEGVYEMTYLVEDFNRNLSRLDFRVFFRNENHQSKYAISSQPENGVLFRFDEANEFISDDLVFEAPAGAFYDSFFFEYDTLSSGEEDISVIHRVHRNMTPIHIYCKLKIKPEKYIDDQLRKKCLLVTFDDQGEMVSAGGEYENGFVTSSIRQFGDYKVALDTVPPEVKPLYGSGIKNKPRLGFRVKDDLSGISSYRGELNGEWVLMEHDAKNDLLYYQVDERLRTGENTFKLVVTDAKDNKTEYETLWIK